MSGMRQKIQYSLALEPAHQGETPVGGCQGTEPVVVKPAPQSPALAPTPCRCPSLTPSNRRVRDPYARWCGRGGTARCPPIPILGATSASAHAPAKDRNPSPKPRGAEMKIFRIGTTLRYRVQAIEPLDLHPFEVSGIM